MKSFKNNKDKKKIIRSIVQGFIILLLIIKLINTIFNTKVYKPYDTSVIDNNNDNGFIALSYFAVDRDGTNTMISTNRLEEHFQALKKNGYISITQKDIEDYYNKGKTLPDRAMFLMFEDGRRDTAIFSNLLLEKYNFIGTILNYGNKLQEDDPKFLSSKDINKLKEGGFWEIGSNGYRLSYINVFDRYNNYLGELNSDEYSKLNKYIDRDYDHYLMDFIRDEKKIPKENYNQMEKRITKDYLLMEDIYKKEIGEMPKTYVLMHSNTGQYGTNKKVSKINEELIKKYFSINFNREGNSLNNKKTNIYDLTRIQPQAYWYVNHLLMKIKSDTNQDIKFVEGNANIKKDWDVLKGAAEFRKGSIIVTSEPEGRGLIRLAKNNNHKNYSIHTRLAGNILGNQKIYLNADEELKEYTSIKIKNNNLYVEQNGKEIYILDLNKHDEIEFQSIEENKLEALNSEYKVYIRNIKKRKNPTKMEPQKNIKEEYIRTIGQEDEKFIPEIQINEVGSRQLDIYVKANKLSINIDGKEAAKNLTISPKTNKYIFLESAMDEYGYSQRNLVDDIYDAVFEDLVIKTIDNNAEVIYINKLQGKDLIKEKVLNKWNKIINWFIKNL